MPHKDSTHGHISAYYGVLGSPVLLRFPISATFSTMALVPVVNSGLYRIRNVKFGAIRDDDGALGAKGASSTPELLVRRTLTLYIIAHHRLVVESQAEP